MIARVRVATPVSEPTIAAGFARALVDLAVSKGADRATLLATATLDEEALRDQDNRVPLARYAVLMRAAKRLSGDPALALHFGEAFDIADLSIVGLIGQAAETFAEAFAQLDRYSRLVADVDTNDAAGGKRLILLRENGKIWLVDARKNPNDFPEMTESSFARMISAQRRSGGAQFVKEIHVTHSAPSYRAEYDRIFQLPVIFDSDRNALLMTGDSWLTLKTPSPSRYVFGILNERAGALLESLESAKTTRGQVESQLMPVLHKGKANMDAIAGKMGLSRATLFRRLKAEGVTFEAVLDDLRHEVALGYLAAKKVSVNETAYLVGFSDPAAFSRAFKRWTGTNPGAVRAGRAPIASTNRRR